MSDAQGGAIPGATVTLTSVTRVPVVFDNLIARRDLPAMIEEL